MIIDTNGKWHRVLALVWIQSTIGLIVIADILVEPIDTEVKVGEATYLNCSLTDPSGEIMWLHYPVGKGTAHDLRYVYADEKLYEPYDKRFQIEIDKKSGSFNLIITQAELQDAGLYVCQNGGGSSKSAKAELIVLESLPSCSSNIDARGLIGSNSCGIQTDTIGLSCNINYAGNIHPMLQWTKQTENKSFLIPDSCSTTGRTVTCNYTVEASSDLDGYSFICETNRSKNAIYSCKTKTVTILSGVDNRPRTPKTIGDVVTCPIKPTSYDCNYAWIWYDGDYEKLASQSLILEVNRTGLHRCEAKCHFREFKCNFAIMSIEASIATVTHFDTTAKAVGSVLGAIILILICVVVYLACNAEKRKRETGCKARDSEMEVLKTGDDVKFRKFMAKHPGMDKLQNQDVLESDPQSTWTCKNCTYINHELGTSCLMCNRDRSSLNRPTSKTL